MTEKKAALRALIRRYYQETEETVYRLHDGQIISRLLEESVYRQAERIFLYVGVGREINTHSLIENAVQAGKIVALPKSGPNGVMKFYRYDGEIAQGRFGIPEPQTTEELIPRPGDLMIVPGLAFTADGLRLGQGGGYYDRYLSQHSCVTVGLCRQIVLFEELPVEWNDFTVDFVITEQTVISCKKTELPKKPRCLD